ncbi:MAG: acetyl-CoA carboxylase biotin carboxylase subunit, partial [Gemmataceae bacterium]
THAYAGYRVPPNYDSLVAKLLAHGPNREQAIAIMRRALREFRVEGVHTTIPLHQSIMNNPTFIAGEMDTTFLEREMMGR